MNLKYIDFVKRHGRKESIVFNYKFWLPIKIIIKNGVN